MHDHTPSPYEIRYRRAAAWNQFGGFLSALGGIALILGGSGLASLYLPGTLLVVPGILIWVATRKAVEAYETRHGITPRD